METSPSSAPRGASRPGRRAQPVFPSPGRRAILRRALRLGYFTIAWNGVEAVVGLVAGVVAGSVALVGFALDSIVEMSSGAILVWRLRAEQSGTRSAEEAERKAIRMVSLAFFALAAYVGARGAVDLVGRSRPHESLPGMVLAALSLVVMPVLARRKRNVARKLDSRSLRADSTQTSLCTFLSAFLLVGLLVNGLLGWWWADPLAGILIALFAAREGRHLWKQEDLCC